MQNSLMGNWLNSVYIGKDRERMTNDWDATGYLQSGIIGLDSEF